MVSGKRDYRLLRDRMVDAQLEARGISDQRVLAAMRRVPRDAFVPAAQRSYAYEDRALVLGNQQTISQPYIVALMASELDLKNDSKLLEVGSGSGYFAAICAQIAESVCGVEIDPVLAARSRRVFGRLGYSNIMIREGDGAQGWHEQAPFDRIAVSAAAEHIPRGLIRQLKIGGRLILPVGEDAQSLVVITKEQEGLSFHDLGRVAFVPLKVRNP